MTIQLSTAVRDARLNQFESTTGTDAILRLRTGAPPANCAAADTGTIVASMTLPTDWMNAASGGTKTKLGTWQDLSADNAGIVGHFRIYDSAGTTCHMQGTCAESASDMIIDNADVNAGQSITVNSFTLTDGNA